MTSQCTAVVRAFLSCEPTSADASLGSSRPAPLFSARGPVAQRLEQSTHNRLVVGSNPTGPTSIPCKQISGRDLRFHGTTNPSPTPRFVVPSRYADRSRFPRTCRLRLWGRPIRAEKLVVGTTLSGLPRMKPHGPTGFGKNRNVNKGTRPHAENKRVPWTPPQEVG